MRRLLPVGLVVVLGLIAGCSDDDPEPKVADPTDSSSAASTGSPTPDPSPSPTAPVAPTLPAEAQGTDAAAAEAFVRFYWETVNYAQATGDTESLRQLGDNSCSACTSGADGIEETFQGGGSILGGEVLVSRATARRVTSRVGAAFAVNVEASTRPQVVRAPDGSSQKFEGGESAFQFILRVLDGAWSVMRLDVTE